MKLETRLGILGGGQLGKMLLQAGSKWNLQMSVLEKDNSYPSAAVAPDFHFGDFTNYDNVYNFGKQVDLITIEIENVNAEALSKLAMEGKKVYPQPRIIEIIKDKGVQKKFYRKHNLPTSDFILVDSADHLTRLVSQGDVKMPFVQKARTLGYDGRGVQIVRDDEDLRNIFDAPSVIETLVDVEKEVSVIVARNPRGEIATFPAVEMTFHPTANLVENLISPARISAQMEREISALARKVMRSFDMVGLLAIELFVTPGGEILINEAAPRPHNSGHHTIEGNITSQYEQHLRAILNMPLGATDLRSPAVMINLLGEEGHDGFAEYDGLEKCLAMDNVFIHLYGKKKTRPYRKMGHVTILDKNLTDAMDKARRVASTLKVISAT